MLKPSKNLVFITIFILIFMLGTFLRFVNFTNNPVSLNIDEVAIGYNAYSILKTGRDEYGLFLPLSFKSVGDYKPPVLIYLTVPSIAIFGLNEFGVRFPVALLSSLTILFGYFLFKRLTDNKTIALLAMCLLAISPWGIYYARYADEATVALFLVVVGAICFFKMIDKHSLSWQVLSAVFLGISMYCYYTERLFVPILLGILLFSYIKQRKLTFKGCLIFLVTLGLLISPLILSTIFGPDKTRVATTFITNDPELQRQVLTSQNQILPNSLFSFFDNNLFLSIFYGIRKYLYYFHPAFLFYNGLNMTIDNSYGLGVVYLFELPFLLMGGYILIRKKIKSKLIILSWLLLGILPAALTQNEQHSLRTLVALPIFNLISALGGYDLFGRIRKMKVNYQLAIGSGFTLVVFILLVHAYFVFSVYFKYQRGEAFMEGTKQAVKYALDHKAEYNEIVFDPVRGVDGPDIVSIPHMYVLFYSQYDPSIYQTEMKRYGTNNQDLYGFDKFTIRHIDWPTDHSKTKTLFIGSPWSIPLQDIPQDQILQKIYLTNGKLALIIAKSD